MTIDRVATFCRYCVVRSFARIRLYLFRTARVRLGIEEINAQLEELRTRLRRAEDTAAVQLGHPAELIIRGTANKPTLGYDDRGREKQLNAWYANFEDVYRGSEEVIRERVRWYWPILARRERVLDIGCGRGEQLDIASENHRRITGLDIDAEMVRRSSPKGHHVVQGDGVDYLETCQEQQFDAIIAIQFTSRQRLYLDFSRPLIEP